MQIRIPPIKCQGIKTKLVQFILDSIEWEGKGRWIEPFLGSGVVAFNLAPPRSLLADSNEHIIRFYQSIKSGELDRHKVKIQLQEMGHELAKRGENYYYEVRNRFNELFDPLDFLFLNRSCFNGLMRFNRKGKFNVPFCKKPERFSKSYITKICNQVAWVNSVLQDCQLECLDWRETLAQVKVDDFVYIDPPYIGRHTDYYNNWSEQDAEDLAKTVKNLPCGFAVSMWKSNRYRTNYHIEKCWNWCSQRTFNHFYYIGSSENLRNSMVEVLLTR